MAGRSETSKAARIAYLEQHHADWLHVGVEQDLGPFGPAPDSVYSHFAPDLLYDYVRVPDLPIDTLLEMAELVAAAAIRYSDAFAPPAAAASVEAEA